MRMEGNATTLPARDLRAPAPRGMEPPARTLAVRQVLERGVVSRKMTFPENAPARMSEVWSPPPVGDDDLRAIEGHLVMVEETLCPAPRAQLLSRILALLSHFRSDPHPPAVEALIADDWADDLGTYPMWAVEAAARQWRRSKRFRPQICEMIELCETECAERFVERDRLRSIVRATETAHGTHAARTNEIVRGVLRRVPRETSD